MEKSTSETGAVPPESNKSTLPNLSGESSHVTNPPLAIYQMVNIDVNTSNDTLQGTTVLWLGFKTAVKTGFAFRLHSRCCHITEITVNGIPASFRRRDGLKTLSHNKAKIITGQDLDINYRAALEIAREGELEIIVPNLENAKTTYPKNVPSSSPRDVLERFSKLIEVYKQMTQQTDRSAMYDIPEDENITEKEKKTFLLQVKCKFSVNSNANISYNAVIFRKQPAFVKLFDSSSENAKVGTGGTGGIGGVKGGEKTVCAYTTSFSSQSLRNVDGIRCWLPTIDSPDQRFIFDITIGVNGDYQVMSVGKRLSSRVQRSSSGAASHAPSKGKRTQHRFFTPNRIPAMQVGFFIGKVEAYKMALYKVRSKIWIAAGLADYLSTAVGETEKGGGHNADESSSSANIQVNKGKRPREESISGQTESVRKVPKLEKTGYAGDQNNIVLPSPLQLPPSTSSSTSTFKPIITVARRLYEELVHHSFLGLDMALRLIHKFTGHKYDYGEFTFIFVHELGRDFMAWDGFVLIDMRFLHSAERIYMETPSHLALLTAYLYAWLRSSLPIASYENEFLLHGMVGYLMNFYCDEVYGEDDGQYYFQKMYDTVLAFEKQGRSGPLASFYPERYESFTLYFGEYMVAKSIVLFHIIEQAIGGKDPMRVALKHLIKSPLIFAQMVCKGLPSASGHISGDNSVTSSPMILSPADSPIPPASPPYSQTDSLAGQETPFSPNGGYQSPYPYFQQTGAMSPFIMYHGMGGNYGTDGRYRGNLSPYPYSQYPSPSASPAAGSDGGDSKASITSGNIWERELTSMTSECLSAESFLAILRHVSEASVQLDDRIIDRYIYECGALFLRLNVSVSDRVENKPRTITVTTEQIGYKNGGRLGKRFGRKGELPMLMVEDRDDHLTEPSLLYDQHICTHKQQAHSRPGRRGGKRRKIVDVTTLTDEQYAAKLRADREKELRKSALQLVRDREYPVRYVILDSSFQNILEVQNTSPDVLLVEQLNADYENLGGVLEKHKVFLQIQALRSLTRNRTAFIDQAIPQAMAIDLPVSANNNTNSATPAAPTGSTTTSSQPTGDYSARVQLKACADCILGVGGTGLEASAVQSNSSVFVRAEAAFALARWQNEHAPFSLNYSENDDTALGWPAMELLLDCIIELFMDTTRQEPMVLDERDEGPTTLRNALLLALSTIRSQQGYSPKEVIEMLLIFMEHMDDPIDILAAAEDNPNLSSNQQFFQADDTHSKAVLFLALSRLRYPPIDATRNNNSSYGNDEQAVFRVARAATRYIEDSFTRARALARIDHLPGDANRLPRLPGEGLAVAAAISCLAEADLQAVRDFSSARGTGGSKLRLLDQLSAPIGHGLITDFSYTTYFLKPGIEMKCLMEEGKKTGRGTGLKDAFIYFLCTPAVRLAAFEAFVRLSFAFHHAKAERNEVAAAKAASSGSGGQSSSQQEAGWFLPAAVEALQTLLETESSVYVKQQAAHIFFDTLLERPGRVAMESLSLGHVWGCLGWSDVMAFTFPHRPPIREEVGTNQVKPFLTCRKAREAFQRNTGPGGKPAKLICEALLRSIGRFSTYNQTVRATLLQAWIYVFRRAAPRVLTADGVVGGESVIRDADLPLPFDNDRFIISNPTEAFWDFEQSLQYGPQYKAPVTPRLTAGSNPSASTAIPSATTLKLSTSSSTMMTSPIASSANTPVNKVVMPTLKFSLTKSQPSPSHGSSQANQQQQSFGQQQQQQQQAHPASLPSNQPRQPPVAEKKPAFKLVL